MKAPLCAFVATVKPQEARKFYEGVLGLKLTEDSPFVLVFDANGTMLRVQKVKEFTPYPFTALGWNVKDIAGEIDALAKKRRDVRTLEFSRAGHPRRLDRARRHQGGMVQGP